MSGNAVVATPGTDQPGNDPKAHMRRAMVHTWAMRSRRRGRILFCSVVSVLGGKSVGGR
jgi:hypothetical protein